MLAFALSAASTAEAGSPEGAVIIVIDGLGSSYVYPEYQAFNIEGRPVERAVLYNLTGGGTRVLDLRVPIPETGPSHSVLVTGRAKANEEDVSVPNATIFDRAREGGYICLAILQRGDFDQMLKEQDGCLYFPDNSIGGGEPVLLDRGLSPDLRDLLNGWRTSYENYSGREGCAAYISYNRWALDAAAEIVESMDRPFILFVNAGAVDTAGHNLGPEDYVEVIQGLDQTLGGLREACQRNEVLLVVTADHGMAFSSGDGGHASKMYAGLLESRRVPLVFFGPGIDELIVGGVWQETDIAPTLLDLLELNADLGEGQIIPLKSGFRLEVILDSPGMVTVSKDGVIVAEADGLDRYTFSDLVRGIYNLSAQGSSQEVCISDHRTLDLRTAKSSYRLAPSRNSIGIALILIINLGGALVILWILKRKKG
ncbi:MAG: alkaline phosphatase family protein [Methanotrichaceae archaeon]|nr:alkaline phosphatase family protein [Methanotrichaceae archaeon]